MEINIEMLLAIQDKIDAIIAIPSSDLFADKVHIEYDTDTVSINTEQTFYGCDSDYASITMTYEELKQPIEWWKDHFNELRAQELAKKAEHQKLVDKMKSEQEHRQYLALKAKFEK